MLSAEKNLADLFDTTSEEFVRDPYPFYSLLRTSNPVHWNERTRSWLISKYADIDAILKDLTYGKRLQEKAIEAFELWKDPELQDLLQSRLSWMLNQDPPDHTRLRNLVNKAFTPKTLDGLRPHVLEIANELLDKVTSKHEMDLMEAYAFPLPVIVIAEMLGVPAQDRDKFKGWANRMAVTFNLSTGTKELMKDAQKASSEFVNYLRPLVEERRRLPKNDLITALVQAEEAGQRLTTEELLANCVLLLLAGHETTVNLIGNGMLALFKNQDQLTLLKQHPEYMQSAVDEFLRFDSSVQIVLRIGNKDVELHGKQIKKGQLLTLLLGSANRDPEQFANPDKLDIMRQNNKHLSFGAGIHHCLGFALARLEAEIAIDTLIKRFPNIALASDKVEFKKSPALRGLKALAVKF